MMLQKCEGGSEMARPLSSMAPIGGSRSGRATHVPVDAAHCVVGSDHSALLPAGHESELVACHVEAALRRGENLAVGTEVRVVLIHPAAALVLHVLPADRDT